MLKINKNSSIIKSNSAGKVNDCFSEIYSDNSSDPKLCKIIEVKFKGGRKEFYLNSNELKLKTEDFVVVDSEQGYDIGKVGFLGKLINLKLIKVRETEITLKIIRKANPLDIDRIESIKKLESNVLPKARLIAKSLGLLMKITDIEFRGDIQYATFFL